MNGRIRKRGGREGNLKQEAMHNHTGRPLAMNILAPNVVSQRILMDRTGLARVHVQRDTWGYRA
ncbi:MAG: hypothetical protein IIB14_03825 [Chloroflexi bacterium]|nr:hypothetical protein [Chloroflexota bacterium]